MTRKEQIDWLCRLRADLNNGVIFTPWNKEFTEALNDILEQEPILDKIRAEIEGCEDRVRSSEDYDKAEYIAYTDAITDALVILDNYKADSEDKG